jgi:hypothetical protein
MDSDRIDGEAVSTSKNEYKWDQREFVTSFARPFSRFSSAQRTIRNPKHVLHVHWCTSVFSGDVELLVPFYTLLDTYSFLDGRQALHPCFSKVNIPHTFLTQVGTTVTPVTFPIYRGCGRSGRWSAHVGELSDEWQTGVIRGDPSQVVRSLGIAMPRLMVFLGRVSSFAKCQYGQHLPSNPNLLGLRTSRVGSFRGSPSGYGLGSRRFVVRSCLF